MWQPYLRGWRSRVHRDHPGGLPPDVGAAEQVLLDQSDAGCFCPSIAESTPTRTQLSFHNIFASLKSNTDTRPHPVQSLLGFLGVFVKTLGDVIQGQQHPPQGEVPNNQSRRSSKFTSLNEKHQQLIVEIRRLRLTRCRGRGADVLPFMSISSSRNQSIFNHGACVCVCVCVHPP